MSFSNAAASFGMAPLPSSCAYSGRLSRRRDAIAGIRLSSHGGACDDGLEETERADPEARLKKAEASAKEIEAQRPASRPIRSGEVVMSAELEAVLEKRRRQREEA